MKNISLILQRLIMLGWVLLVTSLLDFNWVYIFTLYDRFLLYTLSYTEAHLTVAYNYNNTYFSGNEWLFSYQLEVSISFNHYYTSLQKHQFCIQPIAMVTVISCSIHNTSDCYSPNNITINNNTLVTSNTLPSHMFFTTRVMLQYVNGQTFTSQNEVVISK